MSPGLFCGWGRPGRAGARRGCGGACMRGEGWGQRGEEEDEEEERHHSPAPVCACGPGNRRRPGLAPKRGSVTRSGACVLCRGPADRTGRGKDGASRTEHGSPVVETGVCPTGRGFGSRCDVRKPWPLKRAHAGAAAVQREISSGSSCPSSEQAGISGRTESQRVARTGASRFQKPREPEMRFTRVWVCLSTGRILSWSR